MARRPENNDASPSAKAFLALCDASGVSRAELEQFLDDQFPEDARKAKIFLREGKRPSGPVRDALISFARERLRLPLNRSWFDMSWHPSALVDKFVLHNTEYDGLLHKVCGSYIHLSRKLGSDELRHGHMVLKPHGQGLYEFMMGSSEGVARGTNPLGGFAVSHSETIFLVGFDVKQHAKIALVVLRRPRGELAECGVRLYGVQSTSLGAGAAENGRAIAKRLIAVAYDDWMGGWKAGKAVPPNVKEWLIANESELDVQLVSPAEDE